MASLIYAGFSALGFILTYGIMWLLVPAIFGIFFGVLDDIHIPSEFWRDAYQKNQQLALYLTPLAATLGVFMFIIKVIMMVSARGAD